MNTSEARSSPASEPTRQARYRRTARWRRSYRIANADGSTAERASTSASDEFESMPTCRRWARVCSPTASSPVSASVERAHCRGRQTAVIIGRRRPMHRRSPTPADSSTGRNPLERSAGRFRSEFDDPPGEPPKPGSTIRVVERHRNWGPIRGCGTVNRHGISQRISGHQDGASGRWLARRRTHRIQLVSSPFAVEPDTNLIHGGLASVVRDYGASVRTVGVVFASFRPCCNCAGLSRSGLLKSGSHICKLRQQLTPREQETNQSSSR